MSTLAAAALALHNQGLHVFPADHPDQPDCIGLHGPDTPCDGIRGKHPAVKWKAWAVAATAQMIELAWEAMVSPGPPSRRRSGPSTLATSRGVRSRRNSPPWSPAST
jgi:hypothetical protein